MKIIMKWTEKEIEAIYGLQKDVMEAIGPAVANNNSPDFKKFISVQQCCKSNATEVFLSGSKDGEYTMEISVAEQFSSKLISKVAQGSVAIIVVCKGFYKMAKSLLKGFIENSKIGVDTFVDTLKSVVNGLYKDIAEMDPGDEKTYNENGEESCWFEGEFITIKEMNRIITERNKARRMPSVFGEAKWQYQRNRNISVEDIIAILMERNYGSIVDAENANGHTMKECLEKMIEILRVFPDMKTDELFNSLKKLGYADPCNWRIK